MKQVINGKVYNTAISTFVCCTSNSLGRSDFGHESSALYVTQKGAFFVAGRGGPMSRFKRDTGDGWTDGDGIIVLTKAEALAECEKHGDSNDIEEHFADMIEEA